MAMWPFTRAFLARVALTGALEIRGLDRGPRVAVLRLELGDEQGKDAHYRSMSEGGEETEEIYVRPVWRGGLLAWPPGTSIWSLAPREPFSERPRLATRRPYSVSIPVDPSSMTNANESCP